MGLADLTKHAVKQALAEAEAIGRPQFLQKYGFGPARSYFLLWNGERFDSKAIAGAAHGFLPGEVPLKHEDFSGGERTVAERLRSLGFEVVGASDRNPPWTRDELILALDLYISFAGNPPGKTSSEITALSALLNQLAAPQEHHEQEFRNANGVYMKLMNFRRFDPAYQAQGKVGLTRGNKLEKEVWEQFAHDPTRLKATAEAIRGNLVAAKEPFTLEPEIEEAEEGRVLTKAHLVRERSRKLVQAKKTETLAKLGKLTCEACGFDFNKKYGLRGEGFIEVHHALPVHQLTPGAKTKLSDLHLLCANCHRMVHARRPWLTLGTLKDCISANVN